MADYIKNIIKRIEIVVEPCFSPMKAYINKSYLLNRNIGFNKGCGAGRNGISVDIDGNLTPCRHLLYPESYDQIEDYWWHSEVLEKLRKFEDNRGEPCVNCYYKNNCISCRAVASKVENNLFSATTIVLLGGDKLKKIISLSTFLIICLLTAFVYGTYRADSSEYNQPQVKPTAVSGESPTVKVRISLLIPIH